MSQEEGFVGRQVGGMIRRSIRARLRNLYWKPNTESLQPPVIFYANHHGWLDGYVMFYVVTKLGIRALDWIEEFAAFPLFSKIGGMPYPKNDAQARATTIRKTIRLMNTENRSLVLFAEGVLHRPPELFPFGRALEIVAEKVKNATLVPVAIYYEMSIHERPEVFVSLGQSHSFQSLSDCETRLGSELQSLKAAVVKDVSFELLAAGTASVNERMDMRRFKKP